MIHTASNASPARETNDFDHVNEAFSRATLLVERVEALANSLVGQLPPIPIAANGKISEVIGGVIPSMGASAQRTHSRLGDAMEALDRIQRALP